MKTLPGEHARPLQQDLNRISPGTVLNHQGECGLVFVACCRPKALQQDPNRFSLGLVADTLFFVLLAESWRRRGGGPGPSIRRSSRK